MEDDKLVRLLSLRERKEAIEEQLDWIDQITAIEQHNYNRRMAYYSHQREALLRDMGEVIREEMRGRGE